MRVRDISIRNAVPGNVHTEGGRAVWEFKLKMSDAPCQTWRQAFLSEAEKPEFTAVAKYRLLAEPDSDGQWTLIGTCGNAPHLLTNAVNNAAVLVQRANEAVRAEASRQAALQKARATEAEHQARAKEQQQREFERTFQSVVVSSGLNTRPKLSIRWKIFIAGVMLGLIAGWASDDWSFGVHIVATVSISLIWSLQFAHPSSGYSSRNQVEAEGGLALLFLGLWFYLIIRLWKGHY